MPIATELVRVCSFTNRDRADAITRDLQQAGSSSDCILSDRTVGPWDVGPARRPTSRAGASRPR